MEEIKITVDGDEIVHSIETRYNKEEFIKGLIDEKTLLEEQRILYMNAIDLKIEELELQITELSKKK